VYWLFRNVFVTSHCEATAAQPTHFRLVATGASCAVGAAEVGDADCLVAEDTGGIGRVYGGACWVAGAAGGESGGSAVPRFKTGGVDDGSGDFPVSAREDTGLDAWSAI
jgi:hypothetical protein